MRKDNQFEAIKLQREKLAKELIKVYKKAFEEIASLEIGEGRLAKITQLFLQSRDGALNPLKKEIEKPIITSAPEK